MGFRNSIMLIYFSLFLLSGCSKSNYISQSETPEDLNGFLGFRWTTPMDVVDNQLMQMTNAESVSNLNGPNTISFSNINFLGRKSPVGQFVFDLRGLSATKLIFYTTFSNSESDLDYFRDKLTAIYGIPIKLTRPAFQKEYREYICGYYWFHGRLALALMPGQRIIINSFRDECRPPDAPPIQTASRQYSAMFTKSLKLF